MEDMDEFLIAKVYSGLKHSPAVTHIVMALPLLNPKTNRRHKHFKMSCQMIDDNLLAIQVVV